MNQDRTKHSPAKSSDLYAVRLEKLNALKAVGRDPFLNKGRQEHRSKQAMELYREPPEADSGDHPEDIPQETVSVAGRIVVFRIMGKASFVKIQDQEGLIQLYVTRDELPEGEYNQYFKKLDLGDIISVSGPLFKTKTGEITVRVKSWTLLAKALRPLPEKWHGMADSEQIYRQRYLDLISSEDSRTRLRARSAIIREIREFLWERNYIEVETPVLQGIAGGAAARPFVTHFNALDCDFYLRIALELYLKRVLVGGVDRVFEIGRVFRNEGLSRRHNPEFTMLELYEAYSDYRGMMRLIRDMILHLCDRVLGTRRIALPGQTEAFIQCDGPWREVRYKDLIRETTGEANWFSLPRETKLEKCAAMGLEVNPSLEDFEITNNVFEKRVEPTLIQPTFVTHLPGELVPLAKFSPDDPETVEVFELCINGQEIAPAYTEQNDPVIQREILEAQVGEEIQKLDVDFIRALEHGMPPAGGMGVGIDRLVIFMTGASNIRDTILFPTLRPEAPGTRE